MKNKDYVKKVEEWLRNEFGSLLRKPHSIFSLLETLGKEKIQMHSCANPIGGKYVIHDVIEGELLIIKSQSNSIKNGIFPVRYYLLYQRNNTFVELIFPFEEEYSIPKTDNMLI